MIIHTQRNFRPIDVGVPAYYLTSWWYWIGVQNHSDRTIENFNEDGYRNKLRELEGNGYRTLVHDIEHLPLDATKEADADIEKTLEFFLRVSRIAREEAPLCAQFWYLNVMRSFYQPLDRDAISQRLMITRGEDGQFESCDPFSSSHGVFASMYTFKGRHIEGRSTGEAVDAWLDSYTDDLDAYDRLNDRIIPTLMPVYHPNGGETNGRETVPMDFFDGQLERLHSEGFDACAVWLPKDYDQPEYKDVLRKWSAV